MRCLICGKLTLKTVCIQCEQELIVTPKCREIEDFKVYSFFEWEVVESLLHAKYQVIGDKIYAMLAKIAITHLKQSLKIPYCAYSIGIDDKISQQGYAHNAILLHFFKTIGLKPLYGTIHATNPVSYAGKTLQFRKENPRNFTLKREVKGKQIVLIDDIITTGLTLLEAKQFLENKGAQVLNAFVLADARKT